MKRLMIILITLITLFGCATAPESGVSEKAPFTKWEMRDTRTKARVVCKGTSSNMSVAEKMALMKCRTELAKKLFPIKFEKQEDSESLTFENKKFDALVSNTRVANKKIIQDSDGVYTCWIIMEASLEDNKNKE